MSKSSTLILKIVISLIGTFVLALCIFVLPRLIIAEMAGDFDYLPILLGMYIPALPFFIALFQGFKLLNFIDKGKVFSQASVNALKVIKYCGFAISALYTAGMPYIFYVADMDDAPGVALLGFIFVFASLVVGTAAAIFQKLLANALDIKAENELAI